MGVDQIYASTQGCRIPNFVHLAAVETVPSLLKEEHAFEIVAILWREHAEEELGRELIEAVPQVVVCGRHPDEVAAHGDEPQGIGPTRTHIENMFQRSSIEYRGVAFIPFGGNGLVQAVNERAPS